MKAALFYGPRDLRHEELDKPQLSNGEILVRVKAALTGGTDIKTYLNGHPRIIKSIPSSFGYEFAGEIVEMADDLKELEHYLLDQAGSPKIGDRVVAANTAPCYQCFYCKKQEYSLCEDLDFLNGAFSEFIKIPARIVKNNLYKIPEALSYQEAALMQSLAVVLHGFKRSHIQDGDTVTVYGLGPIGLSFIKLAKSNLFAKDLKVIALGRSEMKRKLAQDSGADHVLDLSKNPIGSQAFKDLYQEVTEHGADIVIEAVGKAETWQDSLRLVRRGGLVNFFGGCPKGTKVELDSYALHYDEVRTIGVFHHSPEYIREALSLLADKKIDLSDLLSHEMPQDKLEDALKLSMKGQAIKVLIKN